jgi:uncharacterized membrane protein (DUF2068 family)
VTFISLAELAASDILGKRLAEGIVARSRTKARGGGTLLAIAIFKFVKGAALLALTCGAFSLFHKDVAEHVERWLDMVRVDSDNRYVGALLTQLNLVHTKELKELTVLGAFYSALFLTEGTGLLLRARWAEWLTIVATSLFIPLEVYELLKEFTAVRLSVLVVNCAIVLFLVYRVRQKQ